MSGIKHNGIVFIKTGEPDINDEDILQYHNVHINGERCGKIKLELVKKEERMNLALHPGNIVKCQYVPQCVLSENILTLLPHHENGRVYTYNHPEELFRDIDNVIAPFINIFAD